MQSAEPKRAYSRHYPWNRFLGMSRNRKDASSSILESQFSHWHLLRDKKKMTLSFRWLKKNSSLSLTECWCTIIIRLFFRHCPLSCVHVPGQWSVVLNVRLAYHRQPGRPLTCAAATVDTSRGCRFIGTLGNCTAIALRALQRAHLPRNRCGRSTAR